MCKCGVLSVEWDFCNWYGCLRLLEEVDVGSGCNGGEFSIYYMCDYFVDIGGMLGIRGSRWKRIDVLS